MNDGGRRHERGRILGVTALGALLRGAYPAYASPTATNSQYVTALIAAGDDGNPVIGILVGWSRPRADEEALLYLDERGVGDEFEVRPRPAPDVVAEYAPPPRRARPAGAGPACRPRRRRRCAHRPPVIGVPLAPASASSTAGRAAGDRADAAGRPVAAVGVDNPATPRRCAAHPLGVSLRHAGILSRSLGAPWAGRRTADRPLFVPCHGQDSEEGRRRGGRGRSSGATAAWPLVGAARALQEQARARTPDRVAELRRRCITTRRRSSTRRGALGRGGARARLRPHVLRDR